MNGTWKEKLGGYNHKGSKRRKQTRNHTLNDKGLYFSRKENKKSVRFEGDFEIVPEFIVKHGEHKYIYRIRIDKEWGATSFRNAYCYGETRWNRGEWYDAVTHDRIYSFSQTIRVINVAWKEYTHYDEPKVVNKYLSRRFCGHSNSLTFIYGKPVYDWKRYTFYNDGKRRKIAQKNASASDRRIIREWIARENWDAEIPTHATSKSVAWEVS